MPATATPRRRIATTSLYTDDTVYDPSTGKQKYVPNDQLRNSVGDQGAAKVKAARNTLTQSDDTVSSSDEQDTPTSKAAKDQATSDAMVAKLKAMAKKAAKSGGSTVNRGLLQDTDEDGE